MVRSADDGGVHDAGGLEIARVLLCAGDDGGAVDVFHGRAEHLPARRRGERIAVAAARGPNRRGCLPDDGHRLRRRQARPRPTVVRAQERIAHDQLHALYGHAQFFGERLRQQRPRSLTHLDLARKGAERAIVCHLHADGDVSILGADGDEEQQPAAEGLEERAPVWRQRLEQCEDLITLGLERLLKTLLVGRAQVFSHGGAPRASPRPRRAPPR